MKRLILGLVLVATACGQPQAQTPATPSAAVATPTATATATPATQGPALFAVLEAKGTSSAMQWNTVAIAGLDGRARAKATFSPMASPDAGCMGVILPKSAHVAAGQVYYADGTGVVRSLSVSGRITKVATFPLTSRQQILSFAVSPDGGRLMATVLTVPKNYDPCTTAKASGTFTLDVYAALPGHRTNLFYRQVMTDANSVMALTGWDALGPFGTYPTVWASQGGGPGSNLGVAVRIDANTGKVVGQVSDPKVCLVWEVSATGDYVCMPVGGAKVSIRRPDGSEIWQFTVKTTDGLVYGPELSPDEASVAVGINSATDVVGRAGRTSKVGFYPSGGWLDSSTLIGGMIDPLNSNPNLAYVNLSAPGTVLSLGFAGLFVGTFHT